MEAAELVASLMAEYAAQDGNEIPTATTRGRKRSATPGAKRAPRSLDAIVMTSASRLLGEMHKDGKKKPVAVASAIEKAEAIAMNRKESLSSELKGKIDERANEIWSRKP
jgi:hypothetical protein